jgi:hypothetical protein
MMTVRDYGLGRIYHSDERDQDFTIRAFAAARPPEERLLHRYWWDGGAWWDQGNKPWCVAGAWLHWMEDGPITHEPRDRPGFIYRPRDIYRRAQEIDEFPGNNYDGTSVRAGAKVLSELGVISDYHWAWTLEDAIEALLYHGPVVVGTKWYGRMFDPRDGFINIDDLIGSPVGGHAYLLNGVNVRTKTLRIKNSWGHAWGRNGRATITWEAMTELIHQDGEVCLAIERSTD